jgi:hypothetical protein
MSSASRSLDVAERAGQVAGDDHPFVFVGIVGIAGRRPAGRKLSSFAGAPG